MKSICTGSSKSFYTALLPRGFSGKVMNLIVSSWSDFNIPASITTENQITALFRNKMLNDDDRRNVSFITLEDPIVDEKGNQVGRNDLRFYPMFDDKQRKFFVAECKCLHTKNGPLISEYVKEGMMRFIDGRYSDGLNCGCMIGYVIDGNTEKAFISLKKKISEDKITLKMKQDLACPSRTVSHYKFSADTAHLREKKYFDIHHTLLAANFKS